VSEFEGQPAFGWDDLQGQFLSPERDLKAGFRAGMEPKKREIKPQFEDAIERHLDFLACAERHEKLLIPNPELHDPDRQS
jgi:hypothetical protein